MKPEEASRLLQAYLDGELDPLKSVEFEAQLAQNPALRAACERLREASRATRAGADYYTAPAALVSRLRAAVPAAPGEVLARNSWRGLLKPALSVAAIALVTWAVTFVFLRGGDDERLAQELFASHVRATLANRLIDVASSDQHTVKPWLSARLDFSPPVEDLSAEGFELLGARLDYIGGRSVAVLVYKRRQHRIDVFVWPAGSDAGERTSTRDGFNLERFARGNMNYWIVSDLSRGEIGELGRLIAARTPAP